MNVEEFNKRLNDEFNKFDLDEDDFLLDILLPKAKDGAKEVTGDFLTDLFNGYDVSDRSIAVDFHDKLDDQENILFFSSRDTFDIGVNKTNGSIVMWDEEQEKIHYSLAPDLDTFLEIILIIYTYGLPGWFEEKLYTRNDRKVVLAKIEALLDKEYMGYYKESYEN